MAHQSLKSEQYINRTSFAQKLEALTPRNDETDQTDFEQITNELHHLPDYLVKILDKVKEKPCYASSALLSNISDTPSFGQLLSLLTCEPLEIGTIIDLTELKRLIQESRQ